MILCDFENGISEKVLTHASVSRTQYPKVPKVILGLRSLLLLNDDDDESPLRSILSIEMLLTTGAEISVMISSTVAANSRNVPMWWKKPVRAIAIEAICLRCLVYNVSDTEY